MLAWPQWALGSRPPQLVLKHRIVQILAEPVFASLSAARSSTVADTLEEGLAIGLCFDYGFGLHQFLFWLSESNTEMHQQSHPQLTSSCPA